MGRSLRSRHRRRPAPLSDFAAQRRGPDVEVSKLRRRRCSDWGPRRSPRAAEPRVKPRLFLSPDALAWVARNLALRASPGDLVDALVQGGVAADVARREVEHVVSSSLGAPLASALRRLDRSAELTALIAGLRQNAPLEELTALPDADTFYGRYWATNTPVIVRGFLDTWQRPFSPTFADLRRRFGDVEMEVMRGRDAFEDPGLHFEKIVEHMKLAEFLDVVEGPPTNDVYMVARNAALRGPLAALLEEIAPPTGLFDRATKGGVSLWLGPSGTLTRLHHDATNNLFCQVLGRKRVTLVPPHLIAIADTAVGFYATERPSSDAVRPHAIEVTLEPGDAVFLPVGWWHEVLSLTPSLSLALVGFTRKNSFPYQPGRTRVAGT